MDSIKHQSEFFCDITKQINGIYEEYAKSVGLTYTSLYTLHMISLVENCTQKRIADQLFLPKQTINSVITSFVKQGIVELVEQPEDRRHKSLRLTQKGETYANEILPKITVAEEQSFAEFSVEERKLLCKLMKQYIGAFESNMKK